MTDDDQGEGRAAIAAFEELRAEVALQRRAIEGLAAERAAIEIPDYSETFAKQLQGIGILMRELAALQKMPALDMTPEQMAARIGAAADPARRADHDALIRAGSDMTAAAREMRRIVSSALTAERQSVRQLWFALGGLVTGILLWMLLPGLVARELAPTTWQWPEKLAARSLGVNSVWEGALRMAAVGSPDTWNMMTDGSMIVQANRETLAKCRKAAAVARKSVRCTIRTGPADDGMDGKR